MRKRPTGGDAVSTQATVTEKRFLNYREAAVYCGLSETTIWRSLKSGALRASGSGRGIRFDVKELDRWMASRS